jgi:hypothetical protein
LARPLTGEAEKSVAKLKVEARMALHDAQCIVHGRSATASRPLRHGDETGAIHEHSPRWPHLGCVVAWNTAEKSWDCPCDGSHFDARGA